MLASCSYALPLARTTLVYTFVPPLTYHNRLCIVFREAAAIFDSLFESPPVRETRDRVTLRLYLVKENIMQFEEIWVLKTEDDVKLRLGLIDGLLTFKGCFSS